jgi:hypothetical protein
MGQRKARTLAEHPTIVLDPKPLPAKAANIEECNVTTDSVVATATVRTDSIMRRIVVQWGDGAVTTLRNRPGIEAAVGQENQLPPGTYKLSHAYAEPEDRRTFTYPVTIRVDDVSGGVDFCIRLIALTPRYKVTNYRTTLTLDFDSSCDSWFESRNEFIIYQYVDGEAVQKWEWNPEELEISPPSLSLVLPGSQITRELTLADESVAVLLDITEVDPWYDENLCIYQDLSATYDSETVAGTATTNPPSGCELRYRWDREVTLIVPLPSAGQEIVIKG